MNPRGAPQVMLFVHEFEPPAPANARPKKANMRTQGAASRCELAAHQSAVLRGAISPLIESMQTDFGLNGAAPCGVLRLRASLWTSLCVVHQFTLAAAISQVAPSAAGSTRSASARCAGLKSSRRCSMACVAGWTSLTTRASSQMSATRHGRAPTMNRAIVVGRWSSRGLGWAETKLFTNESCEQVLGSG